MLFDHHPSAKSSPQFRFISNLRCVRWIKTLLFFSAFIAGLTLSASESRLWSDPAGNLIKGTYLGRSDDGAKVNIRRFDGEHFAIPLSSLGPVDQRFVVDRSAKDLREASTIDNAFVFVIQSRTRSMRERLSVSRSVDIGNFIEFYVYVDLPEENSLLSSIQYWVVARAMSSRVPLDLETLKNAEFLVDGVSYEPTKMGGARGTLHDHYCWKISPEWVERIANADEFEGRLGEMTFRLSHEQREGFRVLLDHVENRKPGARHGEDRSRLQAPQTSAKPDLVYHASRMIETSPHLSVRFSANLDGKHENSPPVNFEMTVQSSWHRQRFPTGYAEFAIDGKYLTRLSSNRRISNMGKQGVHETFQYRFPPEEFLRIANAGIVDVRIEGEIFTLTHAQREPMRALWGFMMGNEPPEEEVSPETAALDKASFIFATDRGRVRGDKVVGTGPIDLGDSYRLSFHRSSSENLPPYNRNGYAMTLSSTTAERRHYLHNIRLVGIEMDDHLLNVRSVRPSSSYFSNRRYTISLSFLLTPAVYKRMAEANEVVLHIGDLRFQLTPKQHQEMQSLIFQAP